MRSFSLHPCLLLVLLLAPAPPAAASEPQLDFGVLFDAAATGRGPEDLQWSPDGRRLAFRFPEAGTDALWVLEAGASRAKKLFAPGDRGSAEDLPINAHLWSPDGASLLIEAGGDLYLLPSSGQLRRLTTTEAREEGPAFSPDGTKVAFSRGPDLYLIDLESGRERALTVGGTLNRLLNGVTDWVYWEEIWGRHATAFWWSPDGKKIAYYQFDETAVASYPLLNSLPSYPEVDWQKYPRAGTTNPSVRFGILDVASGATTWLRTGPDPTAYLARLQWHPDGRRVAVQRLNREQDRLDLLLCSASDGNCETLLTETLPTWVNLGDEFTWLDDGRFIWASERSGWRQLYLYDGDGTGVRELTADGPAATSLDGVNGDEGWLVYTTYGPGELGAADRRVWRLRLDGSEPELLAGEAGWNGATVAPRTGHWVHEHSTADEPTTWTVRDATGKTIAELPSSRPTFDAARLPQWELFTITGPGGVKLPARRLLPAGFDETRRYPAIMYHYGGPASQVVTNRWEGMGRGLWHKMMAERGYLILSVDNEASVFFGKAGEDRVHRRFGELNLAAQRAAVDYLRSLPYADATRVGLWGWSGGGSNTLYCLLNSPGTWRAGVAGAPVTDWHLYDTIWTERYLDHPDDNPEGYKASSAITYADRLADPLLIVHGTADDNVHPQNTLVMSQALIEAGRPFEEAFYPRQKHGFHGAATRHFYERMTAFFERLLGGPEGR